LVSGEYLELQTAVLKALPRDMDTDIMRGFFRNGEYLTHALSKALAPVFFVTRNNAAKTSHMIWQGRYDHANPLITNELFPVADGQVRPPQKRVLELVEAEDQTSALALFEKKGLERPTYEDALTFGLTYPHHPKNGTIVFLHKPVLVFSIQRILALTNNQEQRRLSLLWMDRRIPNAVYAAVQPQAR